MFAVVEIAGQQFKVSKSEKIRVPRLQSEVGAKVKFDKVLLVGDEKQVKIGTPYVQGSHIEVKVLAHSKDDKVLVFKKKKRKGYKVLRGHRQPSTDIEVTKVA